MGKIGVLTLLVKIGSLGKVKNE